MFTKNEGNLERYIDVHIVLAPLSGEKWSIFFDRIVSLAIEPHKEKIEPTDIERLSEGPDRFHEFLEPILNTPRKIKALGRHLNEKLGTSASTICLEDLILLSAIQACNPRLFQWIAGNRTLLVDPATAGFESWAISYSINRDKNGDRKKPVLDAIKNIANSDNEEKLVSFLFFESRKDETATSLKRREIRSNQYYLNYFSRDRLPLISTMRGVKQLKNQLSDDSFSINSIYGFLSKDWNENARADLQQIILTNIRTLIANSSPKESYKLLIALGKLAREANDEGFIYHPKSYASYAVWDYLEEKTNDLQEFLNDAKRVLLENVSHKMYTSIIFYLFTDDETRRKKPHGIGDHELSSIGSFFDQRCKNILYDPAGSPRDVFDKAVSDNPLDLLFRWAQVQTERNHEVYLLEMFKKDALFLKRFVSEIRKENLQGIEKMVSKPNWLIIKKEYAGYLNPNEIDFVDNVILGKHSNGF
jgi:hypothetical protein